MNKLETVLENLKAQNKSLKKALKNDKEGFAAEMMKFEMADNQFLINILSDAREYRKLLKGTSKGVLIEHKKRMESANDLLKLQGQDGTWDEDEYLRGMYNGLELVISVLEGRMARYK
jgi:hypothetical protein